MKPDRSSAGTARRILVHGRVSVQARDQKLSWSAERHEMAQTAKANDILIALERGQDVVHQRLENRLLATGAAPSEAGASADDETDQPFLDLRVEFDTTRPVVTVSHRLRAWDVGGPEPQQISTLSDAVEQVLLDFINETATRSGAWRPIITAEADQSPAAAVPRPPGPRANAASTRWWLILLGVVSLICAGVLYATYTR